MAKVAIVGCGAMGSGYAALMADAGHEVHAVTLWPDHAEAMRTQGLRIEDANGNRTVRLASAGTDTNVLFGVQRWVLPRFRCTCYEGKSFRVFFSFRLPRAHV